MIKFVLLSFAFATGLTAQGRLAPVSPTNPFPAPGPFELSADQMSLNEQADAYRALVDMRAHARKKPAARVEKPLRANLKNRP